VQLLPRKPISADSNVGRGIEFALGIAIFFGIGYGLDHWLGTAPICTIVLFLLGVVGQFAAMWYRYQAAMTAHDDERAALRHRHHPIDQPVEAGGRGTA
jgi:F0F1-type ATP synthase assembly protein I